jgi:D-3-phosphoglycerate dehydrogenase
MKILALDEISESVIARLQAIASLGVVAPANGKEWSPDEVALLVAEHKPDILVVDATPVNAALLEAAPFVKMIACTRGNPVNVDSKYCAEHKIVLSNTPGRNANSVAEYVIAMMINMLRSLPAAMERLKSGELCLPGRYEDLVREHENKQDVIWRHDRIPVVPYFEFMGSEIYGKCLGLVGFGAVGKLVADKAIALGMNVLVYDPYYAGKVMPGLKPVSLDTLASEADIISLHAKDTRETTKMINRAFYEKVKKGAYILNTARGRLLDRNALLEALDQGILSGAALDVYDYEPLAKDDPLIAHPKILCTPHIAGASKDVIVQHSLMAFASINAFVSGDSEIPFRCV